MRHHWDVFRQDLHLALRLLARNPGFAAAAILTLALGIGGSTTIFSIVYAVVLRPLAFPESERVLHIGWLPHGQNRNTHIRAGSYGNLQTLREKSTAFDLIGGVRYDSLSFERKPLQVVTPPRRDAPSGVGESSLLPAMASASIFKIYGVTTVIGRLPDERDEEPGAQPVAVLSHGTWTSWFGRDPGVIGRTLTRHYGMRQRKPVTIVGVLAPGAFANPNDASAETPAWSSLDPDVMRERDDQGRELFFLRLSARLAPDVSQEVARAELAALTPQLVTELPEDLAKTSPSLDAVLLRDQVGARVRTPLLAFLGAVCCLLLVATVNVASLVLGRAIARRSEFATRFALGARPLRVARQLLTESALVAIAGGALGLAVAWWGVRAFVAVSPDMPRLNESGIGGAAVIFALSGVLLATCMAGLVPVLQASRRNVVDGLRRAGGVAGIATVFSRPLALLAAVEVALVLVLLAGTGLLVNSFARLTLFDLGFDPRSLLVATIEHPGVPHPQAYARRQQTTVRDTVAALSDRERTLRSIEEELIERVSGIPGITAAGLTGDDPFGPPYRYSVDLQIGEAARPADAAIRIASPTALETLGMQVTSGRWFTAADRESSLLVAIVNESMARKFWSDRTPIGDRLAFGRRSFQVIGVVADVRNRGARVEPTPTCYLSTTQAPPDPVVLAIRTAPGLRGIEEGIAAQLSQVGNRIKAGYPRRLEDYFWRQLADTRFLTLVLSVFTLLTLAVALVGLNGVLRFLVIQRTREMGIRKALGATPTDLVKLVAGQALRFAIPGCLIGMAAAAAIGPALRSLLFGITPGDPLTLAVATLLLLLVVLVAAFFPARRASAVDPSALLRSE
jgi:predicted permease